MIASNVRRVNLFLYHMKTFSLLIALMALVCTRASAQITLEVAMDQEDFLPGEAVPLAVKITNQSGQIVHLGAEANWLTFSVQSDDGFVVIKNAEVPVLGEFDLESSQMGTKRVDIAPYFNLAKPGRYTITATLRIKDWSAEMTSPAKPFDIITGAKLWSQDFGVPTTNGLPEMRWWSSTPPLRRVGCQWTSPTPTSTTSPRRRTSAPTAGCGWP